MSLKMSSLLQFIKDAKNAKSRFDFIEQEILMFDKIEPTR